MLKVAIYHSRFLGPLSAILFGLALSACGGGDSGKGDATKGTGGSTSGGTASAGGTNSVGAGGATSGASSDQPVGTFTLTLQAATDNNVAYSSIKGSVSDGPTPPDKSWQVQQTSGPCELIVPSSPYCSPRCSNGSVCTSDGQCTAYPTVMDVGAVKVTGIGTADVKLSSSSGLYQSTSLPYPPCQEGAPLRLQAAGGAIDAFTIESKGIAPLDFPGPLALEDNKPLALRWTAGNANVARISVWIDLSVHNGSKGVIRCDLPDTGSYDIPVALVSALKQLGVAGYPYVSLTRLATGSTTVRPGRVDFVVVVSAEQPLTIPGLTSCGDKEPCPAGKTCQSDHTCQ